MRLGACWRISNDRFGEQVIWYQVAVLSHPYATDGVSNISHTPGAVFQARLLDNQEGANTEPYVRLWKAVADMFPAPTLLLAPTYSNRCGDIENTRKKM